MKEEFGNHLIVGVSGVSLDKKDTRMLEEIRPIGVCFFARNFDHGVPYQKWLNKFKNLITDIKSRTGRAKMFLSIDHEGGRVVRTPPPITAFPYAMVYSKRSKEVADAMAKELLSIGINVSWAPSVDIHSNPINPVIGPRAFGTTPEEVIERAIPFNKRLRRHGLLTCAKHFPGHGDTATDSHFGLPVLELDEATVRKRELLPFQAIIQDGVDFVMTSHVLFKAIDPLNPATLSPRILISLLREEMQFNGPIVSDDLHMHAVRERFQSPQTLAQLFNAGVDLALPSGNPELLHDGTFLLAKSFEHIISQGLVLEDTLKRSRMRVEQVLSRALTPEIKPLPLELFQQHRALAVETAYGL